MAELELSLFICATPERVWSILTDLEGQVRWMVDLYSLETSEKQTGAGTMIKATTKLFGLPIVKDVMEITLWDEPRELAVVHEGRFSGTADFRLRSRARWLRVQLVRAVGATAGDAGRARVRIGRGSAPAASLQSLHGERAAAGGASELDYVALRVADVSVAHTGRVLATLDQPAAGRDYFLDRCIELAAIEQPEAEVVNAATSPDCYIRRCQSQRQGVLCTWCTQKDDRLIATTTVLLHAEHALVEGALDCQVPHREVTVGQAQ